MQTYHFNVVSDPSSRDETGTGLANADLARVEAVRLAGQIIKDNPHSIAGGDDFNLEVTDETGLILFTLLVMPTFAPVSR